MTVFAIIGNLAQSLRFLPFCSFFTLMVPFPTNYRSFIRVFLYSSHFSTIIRVFLYSCLPQKPCQASLHYLPYSRTPNDFCVLNLQPNLWHKVTSQLPLPQMTSWPISQDFSYCLLLPDLASLFQILCEPLSLPYLLTYSAPIQIPRQILKMPASWNPECFPHPLPMGEKMSIPWRFVFVPETWEY